MNYRKILIESVRNLLESEQILFTDALNLCMYGELKHLNDALDENKPFEFNLDLLKSVDDANVKKIVVLIESLKREADHLIEINNISENELNDENNF